MDTITRYVILISAHPPSLWLRAKLKCGGFFYGVCMKYTKPPLTLEQQADLLLGRHYLMQHIAPQSRWRGRICTLFDNYREIPMIPMGIQAGWREHPLWL